MNRTFDDRIQDIARLYSLGPAPAERNNRRDDGSAGILVSGSGRRHRTAALQKQNCTNKPIKGGIDV